jgi:hypothetical protein
MTSREGGTREIVVGVGDRPTSLRAARFGVEEATRKRSACPLVVVPRSLRQADQARTAAAHASTG